MVCFHTILMSRLTKLMKLSRFLSPVRLSSGDATIKEVRTEMKRIASAPSYYGGTLIKLQEYNVTHQNELPKRTMRDSYDEAIIPLSCDKKMQKNYTTHMNTLRFGRLLEDLDIFAVWLCIRHTKGAADDRWTLPFAIVTAQVDRIDVASHEMRPDADIRLSGMVTWVGRSSMEATIHVEQDSQQLLEAKFVLVTRQLTQNKSAIVNGLVLETDEEKRLFNMGQNAQRRRKEESSGSLLKMVPKGEEVEDIHRMFLETVDARSASFRSRVKPHGTVWMEDAILKSAIMCHPQEGNIYNRIFGGFLMRASFELAWMNGFLFSGQRPRILEVDDILFCCPVQIGSLLMLSSQVGYTQDTRMQIKVRADVVDAEKRTRETTNVFHFTFGVDAEIPAVIPRTYADAMMYIDSRRHFRRSNLIPNAKL